jgi:hypothetical protein
LPRIDAEPDVGAPYDAGMRETEVSGRPALTRIELAGADSAIRPRR